MATARQTTKTTEQSNAKAADSTSTTTKRQPRSRVAEIIITPATHPASGFIEFLRERAVVGLAVGFVLGTQVQTVVKQLISSFIDPAFKLLLPGNQALSSRTFTLHFDGRSADFHWGALVYQLIDFLFVAFAIYAVIKLFKLDKLDKQK